MAGGKDDKTIGGIKGPSRTKNVDETREIQRVSRVAPTGSIGKVGTVQGIGRRQATRTMSLEEREELFKMIDEEAERMFGNGVLSPERRSIVQQAVKMAVDSGLMEKDGDDNDDEKKKKKR